MTASAARKKKRLLEGAQQSQPPASQGSRSTPVDDQAVTTSAGGSSKASLGDVGAGLSAPAYGGGAAAAPEAPVPAFVHALVSGDREGIKAAGAKLKPSDAKDLKNAYFALSPADQTSLKTNAATNKDLFPADSYKQFQTMMSMPKWMLDKVLGQNEVPLNFEAVGLTGTEATGALSAAGMMGRAVPHSADDVTAMADMAYREARGEGTDGMRGVLHVAANRQVDAGSRWAGKPLASIVSSSEFAQGPVDRNSPEWKQAFSLAQSVVTGEDPDNTNGATYFANPKTSDPAALKQITDAASPTAQIGNHVFYGSGSPTLTSQASGTANFASRTIHGASVSGLNGLFSSRMGAAISAAEAATGSKAQIVSGVRSTAEQAVLYQRYAASGFNPHYIAAKPGLSFHEKGEAMDLAPGPVRDWIQAHAKEFGLGPATAGGWGADPPHIQLLTAIKSTPYDKLGAAPGALAYADTGTPSALSTGNLSRAGVLRKGSSGAAVTELQHFLNDQGATSADGKPLLADGSYGNRTREAVKAWQTQRGLPADGVVGRQTIGKIGATVAAAQGSGDYVPGGAGVPFSESIAARQARTPSVLDANGYLTPAAKGTAFNVGAGQMPGANADFAAGAAAAAIVVNPRLSASLGVSASATLNAAIEHPNEQFISSNREWDPAAARIAQTFRKIESDAAAQDAAYAKQKADAMTTPFAAPVESSAGGPIPKTFAEFIGAGPGTGQGKEFVPPSERQDTSVWGDISRIWADPVNELQKPTVTAGAGSGQFGSDPYRPSSGGPEQGNYYNGSNSNGSSFDSFASGMSSAYQSASGYTPSYTQYTGSGNYSNVGENATVTNNTTTVPQVSGFPG